MRLKKKFDEVVAVLALLRRYRPELPTPVHLQKQLSPEKQRRLRRAR